MRKVRILRFVTRRRLKWVAVIAAGLCAALCVSTIWISPRFLGGDKNYMLWLYADRGRVEVGGFMGTGLDLDEPITVTLIDKGSPTGFDLWFLIEREQYGSGNPSPVEYRLIVPLWFPFVVCAIPAVYLWRTDRAEPWQCASCRYDLRGIETDLCPECGKQFESAS